MNKPNNDFPTMEEIKKDYNELMEIIKDVRTIEQAKELEKEKKICTLINGLTIDEYVSKYGINNKKFKILHIENMAAYIL